MRLSALLASLTFLALAFAGCSGGGDDDGKGTTTSGSSSSASSSSATSSSASSSGTTTSATSTSTGPEANQPPTGGVSAVVNGTNATFSLTGTDADGDELSWELDYGDGSAKATGTELPANTTHQYVAGNYTAQFTLSDGEETRAFNVTLAIGAAAGSAPLQAAAVSWNAGFAGCAAEYPQIPPVADAGNAFYGLVEVDAATIGFTYTAVIDWAEGPLALGADIAFYDADGAYIDGNLVSGGPPITATGTVPAGAVFAVLTMCDGAAEASATYVVV